MIPIYRQFILHQKQHNRKAIKEFDMKKISLPFTLKVHATRTYSLSSYLKNVLNVIGSEDTVHDHSVVVVEEKSIADSDWIVVKIRVDAILSNKGSELGMVPTTIKYFLEKEPDIKIISTEE